MIIGDLELLLDLKNIDFVKVVEFMKNIGDLVKVLVSLDFKFLIFVGKFYFVWCNLDKKNCICNFVNIFICIYNIVISENCYYMY